MNIQKSLFGWFWFNLFAKTAFFALLLQSNIMQLDHFS